mgnify:CR=1 FL=1
MAITINGSGTVTGVSVGGLPDGIVDTDMLAAEAVTGAKQANGSIIQVKQAVNSAMSSESIGNAVWEDISGLSVSITPTTNTNKILVSYRVAMASTKGQYTTFLRIVRDSTAVGLGDQTGSSRPRVTSSHPTGPSDWNDYEIIHHSNMFLDSPGTTSATTYKMQWTDSYGQTFYLNRAKGDGDNAHWASQISHITVMEVVA